MAVATEALKQNIRVSKPLSNNLPYDLIFDLNDKLYRIQIKSAWFDKKAKHYTINTRKSRYTKSGYSSLNYTENNFDYCISYIEEKNEFYIIPMSMFLTYKGKISISETSRINEFKNNWGIFNENI